MWVKTSKLLKSALMLLVLAAVTWPAGAEDFDNPKAKPPQAKPQRRTAAEGVPPLPLPATPLRRSEKKREPAPPALVGMVSFNDTQFKLENGQRKQVAAFPTTQVDIERLMQFANGRLNIRYRYVPTTLEGFSWDPTELPILYVTGWTPMPKLSDQAVEKLQRYLYDGGTLVLHAQCGREEFYKSARAEVTRILPNRQLADLDTDSPLYYAAVPINEMKVRRNSEPIKSIKPLLEAVYLGCRPAIILSAIDLNCSWDIEANPIEGGILYHQDDGLKLGINIITACLADFQYARAWGTQKLYPEKDAKTRDQLVIAQIRHNGDWDPTPHALPNLLKYIQKNTTLNVQFTRQDVDLADADALKHPVLYMTGMRQFKFSDTEVARLKAYLTSGGVLVADSAAGNAAFDKAFRTEIKRVLPSSDLKTLPLDCPIYQMPYKIKTVDYSELVKAREPNLNAPTLEGIAIDGQLAVIYSPLSLSNGWEQIAFAYNRGYGDTDALRIGVNIFTYALTH
ncbi:MAG: DUF4159 domain-containing protein [Phycisphaerae bacterium]